MVPRSNKEEIKSKHLYYVVTKEYIATHTIFNAYNIVFLKWLYSLVP